MDVSGRESKRVKTACSVTCGLHSNSAATTHHKGQCPQHQPSTVLNDEPALEREIRIAVLSIDATRYRGTEKLRREEADIDHNKEQPLLTKSSQSVGQSQPPLHSTPLKSLNCRSTRQSQIGFLPMPKAFITQKRSHRFLDRTFALLFAKHQGRLS